VENYTNRVLFAQTWLLTLDQFPYETSGGTVSPSDRDSFLSFGGYLASMQIQLPVPKVQSVTSITYVDDSGNPQTLDPSIYNTDTNSEPARILPVNGGTWPYPAVYVGGTVKVSFVAGSYTPDTCPASIKQAMLMLIGSWYINRRSVSDKPMTVVPMAVDCLLAAYRFFGTVI
jgi:uncharacterized phiE125 gp8 family phage protein